jgi:hypothetical protein
MLSIDLVICTKQLANAELPLFQIDNLLIGIFFAPKDIDNGHENNSNI